MNVNLSCCCGEKLTTENVTALGENLVVGKVCGSCGSLKTNAESFFPLFPLSENDITEVEKYKNLRNRECH